MMSHSRKPRSIAIVADDLTGACDACVPFAAGGMAAYIGLHWQDPPPAGWQAYAINTDTRCSTGAEAAHLTGEAFALARQLQPERTIKKIDSLLRGNIGAEIAAARTAIHSRLILLAPAFPALGRTVRGGKIRVDGVNQPIDIARRLEGMQCAVIPTDAMGDSAAHFTRAVEQAMNQGAEILIPDTEDESQMQRLAEMATDIESLLWVGSGGLTKAIAGTWGLLPTAHRADGDRFLEIEPVRGLGKPLLLCSGSDHPVTQAQLNSLRQRADVIFAEAGMDGCAAVNAALAKGRNAVLNFGRAHLNTEVMGTLMEQIRLDLCWGLLLTGGDTAIQVLQALHAKTLRLIGEVLPGIPQGQILGGAAEGLPVVTKSGAFGAPDALSRCIAILRSPRSAVTEDSSEEAMR